MTDIPAEYVKLNCWLKVRVMQDTTVMDLIGKRWFERGLVFGDSYPASRCDKSVSVRTSDPAPEIEGSTRIVCPIMADDRFVKLISGYSLRSATVADVMTQYPGPYDLITAIDSGRDRAIWWTEQSLAALPRAYIIGEDGHNEEVIKRADEMGYRVILCDDVLLMGRQWW